MSATHETGAHATSTVPVDAVDHAEQPAFFRVGVVLERRDRPDAKWFNESWSLIGVVPEQTDEPSESAQGRVLIKAEASEQYLWSGFELRLQRDQLENYYHNLLSPQPRIFVVVRPDADQRPQPFLVTLSYDEALAYEYGGETVYNAPMPPVLYVWVERFVLEHYVPTQRRKRQRECWKDQC